jgi:hypothetical protein
VHLGDTECLVQPLRFGVDPVASPGFVQQGL